MSCCARGSPPSCRRRRHPRRASSPSRIRAAGDGPSVPAPAGVAPAPRLPPIVAARARLPFVGRGDERAWLAEASGRAAAEGTVVAALGGHPGVGKTALAARFAADCHADGAAVLFGRCRPDGPTAYESIADALAQLVAGRSRISASVGRRWRAASSSASCPRSQRAPHRRPGTRGCRAAYAGRRHRGAVRAHAQRPALLVLDDVQWADEATLALVAGLTRAALPGPLVILLTFRRAGLGEHDGLRALLHDLRRDGLLLPRTLEGLAAADAAGLVASAAAANRPASSPARCIATRMATRSSCEEVLRGWGRRAAGWSRRRGDRIGDRRPAASGGRSADHREGDRSARQPYAGRPAGCRDPRSRVRPRRAGFDGRPRARGAAGPP